MSDNPPRFPYASPEAHTRAGEMLDAGRMSVHIHPSRRASAPDFPAIDELLFHVGQSREKLICEIEAAHEMLPEALAPRLKDRTDERSVAQRLKLFLELIDRRVAELSDERDREVQRRVVAEARVEDQFESGMRNGMKMAARIVAGTIPLSDDYTADQREHARYLVEMIRDVATGRLAQWDDIVSEQRELRWPVLGEVIEGERLDAALSAFNLALQGQTP
jgi:hypothetical protein